ncbi:MAG: hypothetical protein JRF69_13765 [Deltaproteobacteria bacterium]|nr:hypothetical protein [Deltaproteobacteria bacterium]
MTRLTSWLAVIWSLFFLTAAIPPANGDDVWQVLAKASPDECFYGVGDDNNEFPLIGSCNAPGQLKTNEAYIWGMTKY